MLVWEENLKINMNIKDPNTGHLKTGNNWIPDIFLPRKEVALALYDEQLYHTEINKNASLLK